jgi:hypothetical protein
MSREDKSIKYLEAELKFEEAIQRGSRAKAQVKRAQEWLCLNGELITVDGDFGSATEAAVKRFQTRKKLPVSGIVTKTLFEQLTLPLSSLFSIEPDETQSVRGLALQIANRCKQMGAREAGGQNRGPWVRLFTYGYEGDDYPWCAAFVSWCLDYAAHLLGEKNPFGEHTLSCDRLAEIARTSNRFLMGKNMHSAPDKPQAGHIFLLNHESRTQDWIHTGFVFRSQDETFETLEGNTNDGGSREGYGVFKRTRSFSKRYDFCLI